MTDPSPIPKAPSPADSAQPVVSYTALRPPGRRPLAVSEIISWIIVLVLVAVTAIAVGIEQRRESDAGEGTGETQILLSAKYGIGLNALFHYPGTAERLLPELDAAAKNPADRFRAAIVAGELSGKEEALRRLDAIAAESNDLLPDINTARAYFAYPDTPAPIPEMPSPAPTEMGGPGDAGTGTDRVRATIVSKEDFRKKWGFFAVVAEAYDKVPSDPARASMLATSYRVVAAILAVALLGGGAALIGLVLLIVGLILFARGRLKPAYDAAAFARSLPPDRHAYIEGFALFCVLLFGTGLVVRHLTRLPDLTLAIISAVVMPLSVFLGLFWPRIRGGTWAQWRAAFGIHTGRGFIREIFAGLLGYLAGLPLMLVGMGVMLILVKIANVQPSHPITGIIEKGGMLAIALAFLAASVWAPVTEELLFRGALFSHLRERFRPIVSGIVVGLIFALVHPQGWPLVPVLGTIGFNFAMIREWRGSIIPSIAAHSLHNTLTLIFALSILR